MIFNTMINHLLLGFSLFFLLLSPLFAQHDTTYLDAKFKPAAKSKARYFRLVKFVPEKKQYRVNDFFMSGKLQMDGYSDQPDADHLTGKVVRYYENGRIESICEHVDYQTGWITFYDDKFLKSATLWCEAGVKNGIAYFYNEKGKMYAKGEFKKDERYSGDIPGVFGLSQKNQYNIITYQKGKMVGVKSYYAGGQVALRGEIDGYNLKKVTYFNKKGRKIGECTYDGKSGSKSRPVNGTHVKFLNNDIFFNNKPVEVAEIEEYSDGKLMRNTAFDLQGKLVSDCVCHDGKPYNGTWLSGTTVRSYSEGFNTGWNTEYYPKLSHIWHQTQVIDGKREGEFRFFDTSGVLVATGIFKNDAPWQGKLYEGGTLCEYTEGLKNGMCLNINAKGDISKQIPYQAGRKEGEASYKISGTSTELKGIYQDDKPVSGYFPTNSGNVFDIYVDGQKTKTITYFKEKNLVQRIEPAKEGMVQEFDSSGKLLFEGEIRNGNPWEGMFLKKNDIISYQNGKKNGQTQIRDYGGKILRTETYSDGLMDGPAVWYADTIEVARCIYQKGKPFEGVLLVDQDSSVNYHNGLKNGISKKQTGQIVHTLSWTDGKREGASIIAWRKILNGKDTTLVLKGDFQNDRPRDGYFLNAKTIEHRSAGRLDGEVLTFGGYISGPLSKKEVFRNDTLHGPAIYITGSDTTTCIYRNGEPWSGYAPDRMNTNGQAKYTWYENGRKTLKTKVKDPFSESMMEYLDGQPFNGKIRSEKISGLAHYYNNGKLTQSMLMMSGDTIHVTKYTDNVALTVDKKGKILQKTIYQKLYDTGCTDFYDANGGVTNRVCFENDTMRSGCYVMMQGPSFPGLNGRFEICTDSTGQIAITRLGASGRLRSVRQVSRGEPVAWPIEGWYQIDQKYNYNNSSSEITYFDNSTGKIIATCTISDEKINGLEVIEMNGTFWLTRYTNDRNSAERFELPNFMALLKKIEELQH